MAHTLDTSLRFTGSGAPLTASYTCGSGATVLVVSIITGVASGTVVPRAGGAPTYDGIALTQADTVRTYATNPETSCEMWYLLDPPTGSALTISVPNTGTAKSLFCEASSYKAATGNTSVLDVATGSTGLTQSPNFLVTPSAAAVIVSAIGTGVNTWSPSAQSGNPLINSDNGNFGDGHQYQTAAGGVGVSVSWTFTAATEDWGAVAAAFKEVQIQITGTSAPQQAAQTQSASGSETITGTAAVTQISQTTASSGVETIASSSASTQVAQTTASSGAETISGTSASSQAAHTHSAAGTETISGTSSSTQAAHTHFAAQGQDAEGTAASTQGGQTSTGSGGVTIAGVSTSAQAPHTAAGIAAETITGPSGSTTASATSQASAQLQITGTSASSQTGHESDGSLTVFQPSSASGAFFFSRIQRNRR